MRNWKLLLNLLVLSAAVLWLSSCEGEEELPVEPIIGNIDVDPADDAIDGENDYMIYINSGDDVTFTIDVTAAGGFNVARLLYDSDPVTNIEQNRNDLGVTAGTVTVNDIVLTLEDVTESGTVTIQVVDDAGQEATENYSIEVLDTENFSAVLIGGFLNAENGSFYNSVDNIVYEYQEANENDEEIDLVFYYAETPGYVIAAPDNNEAQLTWAQQQPTLSWPFAVENNTRFKMISDASFDFGSLNTATDIENAYPETGSDETRITNLEAGQSVAFRLDTDREQRYGVLHVVSTGGSSGVDRSITIDVKLQRN